MKSSDAPIGGKSKDINMKKLYIITRPTKLSDLTMDDLDDDEHLGWRDQSRQLQARRWRKLREHSI